MIITFLLLVLFSNVFRDIHSTDTGVLQKKKKTFCDVILLE